MALQHIISQLARFGIPVSEEHTLGWCHSEEYLAARYGGTKRLIQVLSRKAEAGNRRALLQLALVKNDPSVLCEASEEVEEEAE